MAELGKVDEQTQPRARRGFLPIETNTFDRVFISAITLIAMNLLWMRLLEAYLPLYWATALSFVIGAIIIARG
jgi:predicted small integral membrane protein